MDVSKVSGLPQILPFSKSRLQNIYSTVAILWQENSIGVKMGDNTFEIGIFVAVSLGGYHSKFKINYTAKVAVIVAASLTTTIARSASTVG